MDILLAAFACVTVVIHIACAVAVAIDSGKVAAAGQELWPFGRGLWILSALFAGLIAATCYWVVHMSRVTRVDRLAIGPDEKTYAPTRPGEDAKLNPELQKIQQQHAKHD